MSSSEAVPSSETAVIGDPEHEAAEVCSSLEQSHASLPAAAAPRTRGQRGKRKKRSDLSPQQQRQQTTALDSFYGAWIPAEAEYAPKPAAAPVCTAKYWRRRYQLWSKYDDGVLLDDEGWFSVTPEAIARTIANRFSADVVLDGFCGYGGNSIQFALARPDGLVLAVDNSREHIDMARHNARLYGVADRIEFVCADVFHVLSGLAGVRATTGRCPVQKVFLAPPWGGPSYLQAPVFDLGALPVAGGCAALAAAASACCSEVALFLPRNCDLKQIDALRQPNQSGVHVEEAVLEGRTVAVVAYFTGPQTDAGTGSGSGSGATAAASAGPPLLTVAVVDGVGTAAVTAQVAHAITAGARCPVASAAGVPVQCHGTDGAPDSQRKHSRF